MWGMLPFYLPPWILICQVQPFQLINNKNNHSTVELCDVNSLRLASSAQHPASTLIHMACECLVAVFVLA